MAKIVITNGTIHSDDDFNLTSGSDANTRNNFRICKQKDSHTRLRSLSSFRLKTHDFLNTGNAVVCGNLTVHGTCTILSTSLCLTDTTTQDNFIIESTDAGATSAPDFKLYRNSASPANSDTLGHIKFTGKDAAGNETDYASIRGQVQTVTSGSECGVILGDVTINGTSCDIFRVDYAGIWAVNSKNIYISGNGQLRNYGNNLRFSTGGGDYKMTWEPNSTLKMCLNGGELTVCNKVYTPILRATACTFYGACGSSKLDSLNDSMRHTTQYGYIALGPGNSSWAHITTDRTCFYFNAPIAVDGGGVKSYDEDLKLSRAGNSVNAIYICSALTQSCNPPKLFSQQGHTIPQTGNAVCWLKFGSVCIPQHGYKMRMKVVASNGYGSNSTDTTQETTLLFQTANTGEACSGSSVCACVHSFIEGSTKRESDAPYCFIVHEVNSALFEIFGKFNTYTGVGSYYTIESGPTTCWIACNSFVDPDSCSGSCILSIPNKGTIFCTSASTTCICGTAVPQGDICMNNGSRGYKLGTDTSSSGSRAFLVLDSDGTDGIGVGSDYTLIANDGNDTKISNNGPEHIRLCSSSCVAFCKPIATNCIRNHGANPYLNQYSGCCLIGGVHFRDCQGCTRGYVYHDGAANFGLLSCAGSWAIKITGASDVTSSYHHCFLCNAIVVGCVQGAVLCGTSCVKTPMIQAQGGKSCFSAPAVAADDWACSALHIRERGEVSSAQSHDCYAPNINFHWAGRVSNSLYMAANGHLKWGGYNASGCPCSYGVFWAGTLCGNTCVNSPIVCGTTCLATNVISSSGSAASDYGALAIEGNKGGYGGVHFCGTTFMSASDCGGGGIYNDSCNGWVLYYACGGSTYLYYDGSAKLHTLENGVRACKSGCGYIDLCPSGTWGHIITDRNNFYFNKSLAVNSGCIGSYDEDLILHRGHANSTAGERITITSGTTHICQYTNVAGKLAVNASGLTCCCALNCGKADFEVCTGGTATAAWSGGRFRIGADDVNWSTRIRQNGYFETYSDSLNLKVITGNNNIAICPSGTGYTCVVGNLCVTGTVCADGMEGDTLTCSGCCTGTICFNTSCVTGLDAVYDVYVSSNPNCGGSGSYRDIVHMSVYVTTGWSGSAVTKYINHVNNFVRGTVHDSGAATVTAVPKLLIGTTGCECYAAACATCLQIQVAGGSQKKDTCVKIKRVL